MSNPLNQFIKDMAAERPISEVLADILRNKIINGDLLPGTRLVEAELSKLYGVSRGSIREAFRALETEGLIEVEKHRSPKVKGVDVKLFMQMFEIRSVLEAFAARLAAEKIHNVPANVSWAKKALRAWRDHKYSSDVKTHISHNRELHAKLLEIADHRLLTEHVNSLIMPGYRTVLEPKLTVEQMNASSEQHAEILEAVLNGDGDKAESVMREHISNTGKVVVQSFSMEFLDPGLSELRRLQAM